ncbi:uncharacterized protein ACA1_160390 [Acanthamoeba castellanii str. Neff]|nr:uncharacterized protein ACA1_160390 [Acanthamoeba castellanii str. Neff]ELR22151.1 hypothetical protein ACA1_160390 [Acanthamoeba castellanii str. Neff]
MESKSSKKADRIEDNIYRIGVKMYFLVSDKKLRIEDLAVMDNPFRKALVLFSKIRFQVHVKRDNQADINFDVLREKLGEVRQFVAEAGEGLKGLLASHMKPRNIERIDEVISYVTDPDVVTRILLDPLLDDELFNLESAAKHYSQFFYYAEGS